MAIELCVFSADDSKEKEGDALPNEPCLAALAELRHTKYYQVRFTELPSDTAIPQTVFTFPFFINFYGENFLPLPSPVTLCERNRSELSRLGKPGSVQRGAGASCI